MTGSNRIFFGIFTWILLSMAFASCHQNKKIEEEATKSCKIFLDSEDLIDKPGTHEAFVKSTDSFFANQGRLPGYCYFYKCLTLSHLYEKLGKSDLTILYVDSALNALVSNNLEEQYADGFIEALNFKGQLMYNRNEFDAAYDSYFKARQAAQKAHANCALSGCAYNMGMVYYKQKKYNEALVQFAAANEYAQQCSPVPYYAMQQNINNIALCYEKLQRPDSALFYYDSALSFIHYYSKAIAEPAYLLVSTGVINGNIGSVLLSQGRIDSSIGFLRRSYAANIQYWRDNHDALLVHLKLAKAYLLKKRTDTARIELVKIRAELDSINHAVAEEGTYLQLMYQYYEQAGISDSAIKYYRGFATMKDSIWAAEKKQVQADVEKELNRKDQSFKLSLLQKQNELNGVFLWIAGLSLVMALVIVVLVYRNYRKEKRNIRTLTILKEQLEQKDREKDKIMDVVAHDLRGPVSGIYTLADMMMEDEDKTPTQGESINLIKATSESALSLINELMGYKSDIREGIVKGPVKVDDLVNETMKILQLRANEKNILLQGQIDSALVDIQADKEKIKRALTNLIINAIKFSHAGGVVDVTVTAKDSGVLISVKDSGIGIPERMQKGIFDVFTTSKRKGTAGEKSFGLGLAITKQIVEDHGGRIWMESEEGKGTTFHIELPA